MDTTETTPNSETTTDETQETKKLGSLLKSYREAANMDYEQAADSLCLTVGTLKALENEEFDRLPEAPYLRGYLRGYAKLANTSSAEAIAIYEDLRGGSSKSDTHYNFSPSASVNEIIKPIIPPYLIKLGMLGIAFLLITIIAMIPGVKEWASNIWDEFSNEAVVAENTSPETPLATSTAVTKPETQQLKETTSEVAKTTTDTAAQQTGKSTIDTTEKLNKNESTVAHNDAKPMEGSIDRNGNGTADKPDAQGENTTQSNATDNKVETSKTSSESATSDKPSESGTTTAEADKPNAPETTSVDMSNVDATSGEVMVKLVFKDEVWMRVNSKKKKVFSGLKKSGDTAEFKASKPLSFKVGNAPGVDIYINGKLYDQKPYMRGVVAKFKMSDN